MSGKIGVLSRHLSLKSQVKKDTEMLTSPHIQESIQNESETSTLELNYKTLSRKHKGEASYPWIGNDFWNMTLKTKINKLDFIKIKNICA